VDHLVAPIYQSYADVETTILASAGIVDLYFYWTGPPDRLLAAQTLEELTARVKEALGLSVYAESDESLESVVGAMLREQGKTLATAESCTGGLIAKMLTDVPGSSDVLPGRNGHLQQPAQGGLAASEPRASRTVWSGQS
jgi:nicotinamide-nucleotide amidase